LNGDKWLKVEEALSREVCQQIYSQVEASYWEKLKKTFNENMSKNLIFLGELEKIGRED